MTDNLPRYDMVENDYGGYHHEMKPRPEGEWVRFAHAQRALDTLTRALAHYQALGEAVAAEREQALSIIATLGIPDTEDQGGHPVPGATRDTLYALRWAARALAEQQREAEGIALLRARLDRENADFYAAVANRADKAESALTAAVREARADTWAKAAWADFDDYDGTPIAALMAFPLADLDSHPTRRPGAWAPTDGCDCERCEGAREDAAEHSAYASPVVVTVIIEPVNPQKQQHGS